MDRAACVWVSERELVYLGPALGVRPHRTAVPRLLLALDEEFGVEAEDGQVRRARAAYVPARTRHAVATPGVWWVVVYLDPGSYRDVAAQTGPPRGRDRSAVVERVLAGDVPRALSLLGPAGRPPGLVSAVTERGRSADEWPPAAQAAEWAGLSRSQLLRRFVAETGTSYRRFGLWTRVLAATRAVPRAASLTEVAADAGFASPSHLSDTVRTVFGFTASELLDTAATVAVLGDQEADPGHEHDETR